jgi:hypothetical protein
MMRWSHPVPGRLPIPRQLSCVGDDEFERPRSVAGTLGNRRFKRAPGRLSFDSDEAQQLDQGVAADALDNVLELLQRKTREA